MFKKGLYSIIGLTLLVSLMVWGQDTPTIDGSVSADEYAFHFSFEDINMDVYWTMTDTELYVGMSAPAAGWVSVGIRDGVPDEADENVMQGVDFVLGYIEDGTLFMRDDFGDTPFTHSADTDLGGSDDVLEAAGSEANGITTIEYKRPIDTGDEFDNPVAQGKAEVYLAHSDADDFVSVHTDRMEAVINFLTGEVIFEEEED